MSATYANYPEEMKAFLEHILGVPVHLIFEEEAKPTPTRVTPEMVENSIENELYFTAYDAAISALGREVADRTVAPSVKTLTFCVLTLKNGYTVTGESNCVDPNNFDAALGRKIARKKAVDKIWPLLGFALCDVAQEKHND